jgi:TM2 domain-containing membrane protein YozV
MGFPMENYSNNNTARRYKAYVSVLGTTQLHLRNPYIIAWWSAAFPGFGHLLLSKYIRGFLLFMWEVVVNALANVNLAMIYSFQGNVEMAKDVLNTRWLLIYIPIYIFAIWDSYRTTVDLNKVYLLAKRENHRFNSYSISALEINYLDKRNPFLSVVWSFMMPGLGQLYIHRLATAAFVVVWSVVFFYCSHALEAISLLFLGQIKLATSALNSEWLLFFPSLVGFSIYDAYVNTVENNKLFDDEQRNYLQKNYQSPAFKVLKGKKVR